MHAHFLMLKEVAGKCIKKHQCLKDRNKLLLETEVLGFIIKRSVLAVVIYSSLNGTNQSWLLMDFLLWLIGSNSPTFLDAVTRFKLLTKLCTMKHPPPSPLCPRPQKHQKAEKKSVRYSLTPSTHTRSRRIQQQQNKALP